MLKTLDIAMDWGTWLSSNNSDLNYQLSQFNTVGYLRAGEYYHSLLKPTYSTAIPDYAVELATLYLYMQYCPGTQAVSLKRVLKAATNGATWNKYDGSSAWETPGGTGTTDSSAALACSPFSGFVQYQYAAIPLTRAEYLAAKTGDQALLLTTTLLGSWMYFVNAGQPTNTPFIRISYRSNSVPTFF